jgi:hypothetical protein
MAIRDQIGSGKRTLFKQKTGQVPPDRRPNIRTCTKAKFY